MDILRREYVHYLSQHVVDEVKHLVVSGTQHVFRNAPHRPDIIRASCTAKFGVSRQCGLHMARQVYFRNHRYVSFGRIVHDFPSLLLGEMASVWLAVVFARIAAYYSLLTLGAYFRKPRVLLYFDAPALVVCDVPVKTVHIMKSHHVNECLGLVHGEEMAAHVEMRATVAETRGVLHLHGRQHQRGTRHRRNRFAECLYAVEDPGFARTGNHYPVAVHLQRVGFRQSVARLQTEDYVSLAASPGLSTIGGSGGFPEISGKITGIALHGFVAFGIDYSYVLPQCESARTHRNLLRQRNDPIVNLHRFHICLGAQATGYGRCRYSFHYLIHKYVSRICFIFIAGLEPLFISGDVITTFLVSPGRRSKKLSLNNAP